jgi:hypothetical protein
MKVFPICIHGLKGLPEDDVKISVQVSVYGWAATKFPAVLMMLVDAAPFMHGWLVRPEQDARSAGRFATVAWTRSHDPLQLPPAVWS